MTRLILDKGGIQVPSIAKRAEPSWGQVRGQMSLLRWSWKKCVLRHFLMLDKDFTDWTWMGNSFQERGPWGKYSHPQWLLIQQFLPQNRSHFICKLADWIPHQTHVNRGSLNRGRNESKRLINSFWSTKNHSAMFFLHYSCARLDLGFIFTCMSHNLTLTFTDKHINVCLSGRLSIVERKEKKLFLTRQYTTLLHYHYNCLPQV